MNLCFAMPVYNEEKNLEIMVRKFRHIFPDQFLFLVDQNSTDKTLEIAGRLGVPLFQREGEGYGAGVKKIMEIAYLKGFEWLAIIDCDQSYFPEDFPELLLHRHAYDFIVGVRDRRTYYPRINLLGNLFHSALANVLFFSNLKDINSGMWVMKLEKFYGKLDADGMDITMQINTSALKNGYRIKQVPVNYTRRVGESKIRLTDGVWNAWRIIIERFRKNDL